MKFNYKARDTEGNLSSGELQARSSRDAVLLLEAQGLQPIGVTEVTVSSLEMEMVLKRFKKVKVEELIVFLRQLSSILNSGVPLIEGLTAIHDQIRSPKFREIIFNLIAMIRGGASFSEALGQYPKIFSPLFVNMVKAGEKAGILEEVLERLAHLFEKELETIKKVKAAVRYPLYVLITLGIGFFVLVGLVVPKFSGIFNTFKTELPLPTRMLILANSLITNYWYWILILGLILGYAFCRAIDSPEGRREWDRFLFSLPIFGDLIKRLALSRFCSMLSSMLKSGIPMVSALKTASEITDSSVIAQIIDQINEAIIRGEKFSKPIKESKLFPSVAVQMISIGEKSGSLEDMLDRVAEYFDREIEYAISNLTSVIEPVLIFVLGLVMLFLAMGIFLPMWSVMNLFQ